MTGSVLGSSLMSVVYQLPMLLVCVVGLGVAVLGWRKHPRVALLVTAALTLALLNVAAGVFTTALPGMMMARGSDMQRVGVVFGIIGLARALLSALSYGLLVAAAFVRR